MVPQACPPQKADLEELRRQVEALLAQTTTGSVGEDAHLRLMGARDALLAANRASENELMHADSVQEVMRVELIRTRSAFSETRKNTDIISADDNIKTVEYQGADDTKVSSSLFCCSCSKPKTLKDCSFPQKAAPLAVADNEDELEEEEIWTGALGKAHRTAATMAVGAKMYYATTLLEKELEKQRGLSEDEIQARWNVVHRANAKLAFNHIMKFRGMFIKVGQKISTMGGSSMVPEPWIEEFEPLQDHVPTSSFVAIERVVHDDLGKPLNVLFSDFEPKPIASASIGQAHVAYVDLQGVETKVCVKVQHPGIFDVVGVDLNNTEFLLTMMMKYYSEAPDVTELIASMKEDFNNEVDFTYETKNAADACKAIAKHGMDIGCPEPLMNLCGHKVMTMHFIEGWKITEVEKLPPDTSREHMAAQIVEAFAMLVFDQGLVHGDPHPGNILVEKVGSRVRPVLLDWGMAKRITPEQCRQLAKWVVACLSRDRFMYTAVLREMGLELTDAADCQAVDLLMFGGTLALRDTVPASSMREVSMQMNQQNVERKEAKKKKSKDGKNVATKIIGKVPGWNRLLFRGLNLLQDVCGMLEVSVPVAKIMLRYALPVVGMSLSSPMTIGLAAGVCSTLEEAVRMKLQELNESPGKVLGAQIAVLQAGEWQCNTVCGLIELAGNPILETSLLPLLDASSGVLIACLLSALSRKTVTGKVVELPSPVERLWPEFSRGGKGHVSIRDLLEHRAGLEKPFKGTMSYKTMYSEQNMEKSVASSPFTSGGASDACHVLGIAAGALLRRSSGHKTVAEALRSYLEPLGLDKDIVYHCEDSGRMTHVCHALLEQIGMAAIWESLEVQQKTMMEDEDKKPPPWLSWNELNADQPWCTDPLLINCEELRSGKGCMVGRGLRATAKAVCRLYESDLVPSYMQTQVPRRKLQVESLEEWDDLGRCLDVAAGLQIFKFQRLDDGGDVFGYGYCDGATGTITLRVQGTCIAILLSSIDKESRHVGHDILSVIASQLKLVPMWQAEKPKVPEKAPDRSSMSPDATEGKNPQGALARLEAQVAHLTELVSTQGLRTLPDIPHSSSDLIGIWGSAETEGMDALFDMMQVPAAARALASKAKMTLNINIRGDSVELSQGMALMGREVQASSVDFVIGEPFQGEAFQGKATYQGTAQWLNGQGDEPCRRGLSVEKRVHLLKRDKDVVVEERYELTSEGRLALQYTFRGRGEVKVNLQSVTDRDSLVTCIDRQTKRLKKEVRVDAEELSRGGLLVSPGLAELSSLAVPGEAIIQYGDLQTKVMFDCQSGPKPAANAAVAGHAKTTGKTRKGRSADASLPRKSQCVCCCGGLRSSIASMLHAIAYSLDGGRKQAAAIRRSSSAEDILQQPPASRTESSGQGLEEQLQAGIAMSRQLSGLAKEE